MKPMKKVILLLASVAVAALIQYYRGNGWTSGKTNTREPEPLTIRSLMANSSVPFSRIIPVMEPPGVIGCLYIEPAPASPAAASRREFYYLNEPVMLPDPPMHKIGYSWTQEKVEGKVIRLGPQMIAGP